MHPAISPLKTMEMPLPHVFLFNCFLLLLISLLSVSHSLPSTQSLYHDEECSALLDFKKSLSVGKCVTSDYFGNEVSGYANVLQSWGGKNVDCCSWDGVECDEKTGHVIGLDLSHCCLHGSINSNNSLFRLLHLQSLNLAFNDFSSSRIPSALGNLSQLAYLNLSSSSFYGQIPLELSNLFSLSSLDLSWNSLEIQRSSLKSLVWNLTSLSELHLSSVDMSTTKLDVFANMSSLTSLHLDVCRLQCEFPTGILQLPKLQVLDLSSNMGIWGHLPKFHFSRALRSLKLGGTRFSGELPSSVGGLTSLEELDISLCSFSGRVPSSLGNLTQLRYLALSSNDFLKGNASAFSWVAKLTKITHLDLSGVLDGELPLLINLTQLTHLDLSSNNLTGPIPSQLMNLTRLTSLQLGSNQLTGPIPSWLMNMRQLSSLGLRFNQLTGKIHVQIVNLAKLVELHLSSNQLQGPIPSSIFELKNLELLDLRSNKLNDTIELGMVAGLKNLKRFYLSSNNISLVTTIIAKARLNKFIHLGLGSCNLNGFPEFLLNQDKLEYLDLSANNIDGNIPGWISNLNHLAYLNLSYNHLTGFAQQPAVLPLSLSELDLRFNELQGFLPPVPPSSVYYMLSNNKFTGEIPSTICNSEFIFNIDLSHNNLNGTLPMCLGNLEYLLSLKLSGNNLHGRILHSFENATSLEIMDLSHNNFEGKLPRSLTKCAMLRYLNVGYNQITDTFPSWLGALPELQVLILRSNHFYGEIGYSESNSEFLNLRIIDMSCNRFTGKLPTKYFHVWHAMKMTNEANISYMYGDLFRPLNSNFTAVTDYDYSLRMSNKGKRMEAEKIPMVFKGIDLSSNRFKGDIPASISNLEGLNFLNLSKNKLSGGIPSVLGNLKRIELLDLSNNELSGDIPKNLVQLTFLADFDISNNHLRGPIPQGKQFSTFKSNSFYGNSGLCGKPLPTKCADSKASSTHQDSETRTWFDWKIVMSMCLIGLVMGAIVSHWCTTRNNELFSKNSPKRHQKRGTAVCKDGEF